MPRAPAQKDPGSREDTAAFGYLTHPPKRTCILLVDDDEDTLQAFEELLARHFDVLAVADPFEARRLLKDPRLAVIISDQWMPGLRGDQLLRTAREESLASRILITAAPDFDALREAINEGQIFAFMPKPIDPLEFISLIRRAERDFHLRWQLRRERTLLQSLLGSLPDAVFFKDRGLRFVELNGVSARLLDLDEPGQALERAEEEFVPEDRARRVHDRERAILRSKVASKDVVEAVALPSGGTRWLSETRAPILGSGGRVEGIVGVARDITERVRRELHVHLLHRVGSALLDAPDKAAALEVILRGFREHAGCAYAEAWALNPTDGLLERVAHDRDPDPHLDAFEERTRGFRIRPGEGLTGDVWETGTAAWQEELFQGLDEKFPRRSAARDAGLRSGFAVPVRDGGETLAVLTFFWSRREALDPPLLAVTEVVATQLGALVKKREAEAAVRASEARYKNLVHGSPLGILEIGADGSILQANPSACRILGREPEELVGSTVLEITHPEDVEGSREVLRQIAEGGRDRIELDKRYLTQKGDTVWARVNTAVVRRADGTVEHLVAMVEDVTERRRLEEQFLQAQKMEVIGRLAGGVAHDFNNLLTGIGGTLELVRQREELTEEALADIEMVKTLVQRGAALTRQLLSFSRRQPFRPSRVDLREALRGSVEVLRRILGEDVRLELELPEREVWVDADVMQVEQVLLNLAVNGRDAMPHGGVLSISADVVEMNGPAEAEPRSAKEYARLAVRDTGVGMDQEALRHLFEPFYTTKEGGAGTGLGLATAYAIVRKHAGFIRTESEPGKGSEFAIHLPLRRPPGDARVVDRLPAGTWHRGRSERILVVEDEPIVRNFLASALEELGYCVSAVGTAEEALQEADPEGGGPDLLLTDLRLPDQTGVWLHRALAEDRPGLPALLVSGYPLAALPLGQENASLLLKPFTVEELASAVKRSLDSAPPPATEAIPSSGPVAQ